MNLTDIANIRLVSQQIAASKFKTPKDLVKWMGAMQAQDYAMAKWAIGLRLPGSTNKQVEAAIDKGTIIRTHLMRPTWHFVAAEDIYWMLELTAPRIKAALKSRHKELELTEKTFSKSTTVLEKALAGKKYLTREELMIEFTKSKIATHDNRSSHLMLRAELDGIVCSGATKNNKQTYALIAERIPNKKNFTKDEALATLAKKYFLSHCPATIQDFAWWSGLPLTDARHAVEMIKRDFVSEKIGLQTYWTSNSFSIPEKSKSVYLLPAYDEFIISYKDRGAAFNAENLKRSISNNGLFKPLIVINGEVTGLWKRTIRKDKVIVQIEFFRPYNKTSKKLIEKAALTYGLFLGKKIEMKDNNEYE
ncbi:MAG TPA: winged helix DNA-binding domain-containing protein [Chitinophagaceae bacterium]|jgi:hypothetical protein